MSSIRPSTEISEALRSLTRTRIAIPFPPAPPHSLEIWSGSRPDLDPPSPRDLVGISTRSRPTAFIPSRCGPDPRQIATRRPYKIQARSRQHFEPHPLYLVDISSKSRPSPLSRFDRDLDHISPPPLPLPPLEIWSGSRPDLDPPTPLSTSAIN